MIGPDPHYEALARQISDLAEGTRRGFADVHARLDAERAMVAGQFELMQKRADERFQQLIVALNDRFDLIDRRFEAIDRRFEAVDRHFEEVDRQFTRLTGKVAGQFEEMQRRMDDRFNALAGALDIRFAALERPGNRPGD